MSFYEHFRKEEHSFIDQVLDWKELVSNEYRSKLSDFLDPRQQKIVQSLIGKHDEMVASFYGGYEYAERKRLLLYPNYLDPTIDEYQFAIFEIVYPSKFVTIEHSQVLGSLMGIGMNRGKFGDILEDGHRAQMILAEEVADYVQANLDNIGKTKVQLERISQKDMIKKENKLDEHFVTVSSLRIDTVLCEVYRLSRSKVKPVIEAEKVKVNWKLINDPSFQVQKGDILSVRGRGRCEIVDIEGKTKKGKLRLFFGFPK